jgi:hypothetical protein
MSAATRTTPWRLRTAVVAFLASAPFVSAAPKLVSLSPIGFERGKSVVVSLHGQGLAGDVDVLSKIPGAASLKPVDQVDGKPAYNPDVRRDIAIEIAPDARVGVYPVRVRTLDGVSNQLFFSVGVLPDVGEVEPNDLPEQAQPVEFGRTIHGAVRPADRDVYKLVLPAGARLVAEVEAKRLGQPMDSFLTLLDSSGREIASNDDAPGLDSDSRIDATLARAGDYYLIVHDVAFQNASAYRLKVGDFEYAEAIYPLGGPRGAATQVWPVAPSGRYAQPMLVSTQDAGNWTMVQPMGDATAALPFRFVVGSTDEILESEPGPTPLAADQTANGRILEPGETDRYRLAVAPGQRWRFRLHASVLGSPLDGVLSVLDPAGNLLARADDSNGLDPTLDFAVPNEASEILLEIADLHGRGGPAFAYRLSAELLPEADFSLQVVNDVVNVPEGAGEFVQVRVDRRGYNGPIQLFVPESVSGVAAQAGSIEAGADEGYLLLSAAPGASPGPLTLEIWGRAGPGARPVDRKAAGSPANFVPYVEAGLIDPMPAALCRPKPFAVSLAKDSVDVVHGYSGRLEVALRRGEAATEPVRISPRIRIPSYPEGVETTIPADKNEGVVEFPGGVEVPLGQGVMVFEAVSNVDGRETRVTLPPVRVRVVRPFSMEVLTPQLNLPSSGAGVVEVLIRRTPPFDQPVVVRIDDLPKGVACEPVELGPREFTARLAVKAETAPPGRYTLKVIPAADIPGRKRDKDYVLAPVDVPLTISPEPPAEQSEPGPAEIDAGERS